MTNLVTLPSTEQKPKPAAKRGRKRTSLQRAQDVAEVEKLALRGLSHAEIAVRIGKRTGYTLSRQIVSYDLARIRRAYETSAVESFAAQRNKELRRLELTFAEAFDGWEKSCRSKDGGNPSFLTIILQAHDRLVKLMGLAAPDRHEISGAGGGPIQLEASPGPLDDARRVEILKRHLARLEQAQEAKEPAAVIAEAG
jgi:hypothetical protein